MLSGGFLLGICWLLVGSLAYLSYIGAPWGKGCFSVSRFAFFPFSSEVLPEDLFPASLGDMVWVLTLGVLLALLHTFFAMMCFASLLIPLGRQHLKLVAIAIAPRGRYTL